MIPDTAVEAVLGIYLGLLAGLFPAVVSFLLGFSFKYLTGVSIPGLGVVVVAGGLAGISGGLLGLLSPEVTQSWAGVTALLVILMLSLWAHAQGDKLGAAVPKWLTLKRLGSVGLSTDIRHRVDTYGQVKIRPLGEVDDIEGYPPLPEETREAISSGSWKFPADLSLRELEGKLVEKLTEEFELAEVSVDVSKNGLANIRAAPGLAGLSRRVPSGKRAVSIRTRLPTGLAKGETVTLDLPDKSVVGDVLSARTLDTDGSVSQSTNTPVDATPDGGQVGETTESPPRPQTTTGGDGEVTVAVSSDTARHIVQQDFAKVTVHSRGKSREFEAIDVLQRDGNQFRSLTVNAGGRLEGTTLGEARVRDEYGVVVLAIRRPSERVVSPRGSATLSDGDELIVAGKPEAIGRFEEVIR